MDYDILKKYVCTVPFIYLEIHKDKVFACCPSWVSVPVGTTDKLSEVWKGDKLKSIQDSILDGTYSYCNKELYPSISELKYNGLMDYCIIKKEDFNPELYKDGPKELNLSFDYSCNLACPSCRKTKYIEGEQDLVESKNTMDNVLKIFGNTVTNYNITGVGEPLLSKTFRNFLMNFDEVKYPTIKLIHLQTNGTLFSKETWNKMVNAHKILKSLSVSVDAATKETYEKVRLGGNWNNLMENIKFIASIESMEWKSFSFVVQDTNYKEMGLFCDLISSLPFTGEWNIYFAKIVNWGVFTDDEYTKKQIWNETHPEFQEFLSELKKIVKRNRVTTNMNDIIEKYL